MRTHTDKNRESKRQSVAAALATTHKGNPSSVSFVDNRPEVLQKKELQGFMENRKQPSVSPQLPIQKKANTTGLPDQLKNGIEQLSGYSMDDVKVHRNSPKPAQLHAHAYAQGTNIHLGPGQEKHLPHEAWHVVQQKQGRVKPTIQLKEKVGVNDDPQLEHEADVMGRKALQRKSAGSKDSMPLSEGIPSVEIAQLVKDGNFRNIRGQMGYVTLATDRKNMGHTYIILETKDGAWMYHFRADAVKRRQGAAQHMVAGGKGGRALQRPEIGDILDNDDGGTVAARVGAHGARVGGVDVAAGGTDLHLLHRLGHRG